MSWPRSGTEAKKKRKASRDDGSLRMRPPWGESK
jgi:hypothetical protein